MNIELRALFILTFVTVFLQCSSHRFRIQYNPKEKAALDKFRELVKDATYADYMKTDAFLIRWLQDSDFNLEKANQKLRKCLEWRKRSGADTMLEDPVLQGLNKTYPIHLSGHDRTGSPIITFAFGGWKIRKLVVSGMLKAISRHVQSVFELGLKRITEIQKEGRNITDVLYLANLAGYNKKEHACLGCLPLYTDTAITYEAYYPGLMKTCYIINAPKIFENILQLINPLLSPKTNDMIKVFGFNKEEWQRELLERISPEQLTTQYGGTRRMIRT